MFVSQGEQWCFRYRPAAGQYISRPGSAQKRAHCVPLGFKERPLSGNFLSDNYEKADALA